jgi:hypothetical protein
MGFRVATGNPNCGSTILLVSFLDFFPQLAGFCDGFFISRLHFKSILFISLEQNKLLSAGLFLVLII